MIAFETPVPTTNVLPSPAVSVSSSPSVSVKDILAKFKLFFRDGITLIHVKFVEDSNTIDAGGQLREMFTLFYEKAPQYLLCGKENQYMFRHDAHLVDNSDFENLGKLMAVGCLLGLPGPRNWSVPLSWYILGSQTPCTISDVPIHEVMVKLEGINNAESQKMLDVILEDFDERSERLVITR